MAKVVIADGAAVAKVAVANKKQTDGKYRTIRFCEPYTCVTTTTVYETDIQVTNDFISVLKNKPKCITEKDGNAYIFGERHAHGKYALIASHGNDIGQTGLVDLTDITENDIENINDAKAWNWAYPKFDWDDRKALKELQKTADRILFVGQTVGGDVGAKLYVHRDKSGDIDSMVIDNNCLFTDYGDY